MKIICPQKVPHLEIRDKTVKLIITVYMKKENIPTVLKRCEAI